MGHHQLAGGNSSSCPELESRTTQRTGGGGTAALCCVRVTEPGSWRGAREHVRLYRFDARSAAAAAASTAPAGVAATATAGSDRAEHVFSLQLQSGLST